ncbi:hypothetical protein E5161_16055 [Cohnella pontilimi]|uniref:Uncharacterized protein n=1 Tax=Cohnella pontilimi TaxID=2564100 RepID=A0A4U0F8C1_9BACL|nr:hypothetical protein [Cohnella pontilimi]TJY40668.1 hypothetical protein E5161_16055 [Cohnella pontilimi]
MYPKVSLPKKGNPSQEWLKGAFAPLQDYLDRHHREQADCMIGYLMFMGNENERFVYKNSITSATIIFDQSGELVSLTDGALDFEFDWLRLPERKKPQTSLEHTHPNVIRWIESKLRTSTAKKHFEELRLFLQELWGPICNYDFSDLKVGFPIPGKRVPHCLYIYPAKFEKLIAFQFPGDEIVEKRCSYQEYKDYRMTEQELRVRGWQVESYWKEYLEADLSVLTEYLMKFIELADWRIRLAK